jgi:alpha/beta superfamily hydrolase
MNLVIFIHGALSSPTSWAYHKQMLQTEINQFDAIIDYAYDVERQTANDISENLAIAISQHIDSGLDKVYLIGHSFGGVVAIDAVRILKHRYKEAISNINFKVLTVSSPLGGSGAASFLRILKPFNQFLKNVGSFDKYMIQFKNQTLPCPVHSIVSVARLVNYPLEKSDGIVTLESQIHYANDPLSTIVSIESNHFEVLLSNKVTEEIKKFL